MPRVRPQPKPEPKKAEPLPPAPDCVDWKDTSGLDVSREDLRKEKVFKHFADLDGLEDTKPIMIYFFWPDEDADSDDKDIANQVRRCVLMDEILTHEMVRRASVLFHSFKCNAKELSDELKKAYKITIVPKVLFFDVKGRKVWQLTSTKAKPEGIANKMASIAAKCKGGDPNGGGGCNPPGGGG